jgi:uncharacterized lipoprotein
MKVLLALGLIPVVALTSSCGLFRPDRDCHKPQAYETSRSIDHLKVPAGMNAPDTRDSLVIPQVTAPQAPPSGGCLDEPPRYRTDIAPEPDTSTKKKKKKD